MIEGLLNWLLIPVSGASEHHLVASIAWHGRLKVLGMGLLMPPVVIVARFVKVTPRQDWPRVFVRLQRAGRCLDAYQAICGLDPELPGNRRRPIGIGIGRRPLERVRRPIEYPKSEVASALSVPEGKRP